MAHRLFLPFPLGLLTVALLLGSPRPSARAADPVVEINPQEEGTTGSALDSLPVSEEVRARSLLPVLVSFGFHTGYDSNSRTTGGGGGSFFTSQELTLSYDRVRGPTKIELLARVEAVERFSRKSDINAFLDLAVTHEISPRLSLSGSIDSAYRAEPDFSTDVGLNQRAGNYFNTTDTISATYLWSDRFSTVTSYSFRLVRYENSFVASFADRDEHTFAEEFRFELGRQTVVVADYRFLAVDYVTSPRDSTTHFLLAGIEEAFTPRLKAQVRAGVSFRSFADGEDTVNPDFEGSVDYELARYSTLSWSVRYRVEEPAVAEALSRTTFRTGLQLRYGFTSKLSSAIGLFYHHDENKPGAATATPVPSFSTNAYDLSLSLRYQLTRHLDLDMSYQYTEVSSGGGGGDYSRNRYSIGGSFTF